MNYPTGMGASTGNHYHNVAAQMHGYVNNPIQRNPSPYQGQFGMQGAGPQILQYGAQRMGVNQIGGFARHLMHNILS